MRPIVIQTQFKECITQSIEDIYRRAIFNKWVDDL